MGENGDLCTATHAYVPDDCTAMIDVYIMMKQILNRKFSCIGPSQYHSHSVNREASYQGRE